MYEQYKDRLAFYVVYIAEAHASDMWQMASNVRDRVIFTNPKTDAEREQVAGSCVRNLHIEMPALLDSVANVVEREYTGWPDRLYLVGKDGLVKYKSEAGTVWFHSGQVSGRYRTAMSVDFDSAVEAVRGCLARIEELNPRLNAVVEVLGESALRAAAESDVRRERGELLGPLDGVPFSVKDSIEVAGTVCSAGTLGFRERARSERDATLVARLRGAGAIPVARTNLPDLLFAFESDNLIFGRTNNPYDVTRSAGGSSGGEAALIAAGGSRMGLGSDAAGSVRVPAHYCGIASLKPTSGRLARTGACAGGGRVARDGVADWANGAAGGGFVRDDAGFAGWGRGGPECGGDAVQRSGGGEVERSASGVLYR